MTIYLLSIGVSNKFSHSNDPKGFSRKTDVFRIEINSIFMYCFIGQKENLYNSVMELNRSVNSLLMFTDTVWSFK